MAVEIVPMKSDFVERFRLAVDTVARERKFLTFLEAPPLPEMRTFVQGSLDNGDPQFVAVADGEIVGWRDIVRRRFPSHAHRGTLGMGIAPGCRSRGVGRRLIDATIGKARANGLTRVELAVRAENCRAITLYEKVGFVAEGVVRDASRVDRHYYDAASMALILRD